MAITKGERIVCQNKKAYHALAFFQKFPETKH